MNKKLKLFFPALIALCLFSFSSDTVKSVKMMIQMKNYSGEGAYVVISVVDKKSNYLQTLQVYGNDPEWYYELTEWWKFQGKKRRSLDGITGETISGGERKMGILKIPTQYIDKGYRLRFESAVEDKEYHSKDLEFGLSTKNLKKPMEGKGFIRQVRFVMK